LPTISKHEFDEHDVPVPIPESEEELEQVKLQLLSARRLPVANLTVLKFKQISLQGIGYSYAIDFFFIAYRRTRSSTGCIMTTAPLSTPRAFFILSIISSTSSDLTTVATSLLVVY
jgi:hypothetical protein